VLCNANNATVLCCTVASTAPRELQSQLQKTMSKNKKKKLKRKMKKNQQVLETQLAQLNSPGTFSLEDELQSFTDAAGDCLADRLAKQTLRDSADGPDHVGAIRIKCGFHRLPKAHRVSSGCPHEDEKHDAACSACEPTLLHRHRSSSLSRNQLTVPANSETLAAVATSPSPTSSCPLASACATVSSPVDEEDARRRYSPQRSSVTFHSTFITVL